MIAGGLIEHRASAGYDVSSRGATGEMSLRPNTIESNEGSQAARRFLRASPNGGQQIPLIPKCAA